MNERFGCVTVGNDGLYVLVDCNVTSLDELVMSATDRRISGGAGDDLYTVIPSKEAVALQNQEPSGWDFSRCFLSFRLEERGDGIWPVVLFSDDSYPEVEEFLSSLSEAEAEELEYQVRMAEVSAGWDRMP